MRFRLSILHSGDFALANGILQGLGDVFEEELKVVENTCAQKGDPFCTFTVTKVKIDESTAIGQELGTQVAIRRPDPHDPAE